MKLSKYFLSTIVGDFLPREIENYPAIFEASQCGDVTGAGSGLASLHSVKVSLSNYHFIFLLTSHYLLSDLEALIYPHHHSLSSSL